MLHVGLDLSRRKLDVCVLDQAGLVVHTGVVSPFGAGLDELVARLVMLSGVVGDVGPVRAVVESMNGARFVRDHLVARGWQVLIADAARAKMLAPVAAKTDRIDAWVLAELSRLGLVPAIWLPGPGLRSLRELTRFRIHLVKHRTMLKNRAHATLVAFGVPCPVSDLFGGSGRLLLADLQVPSAWQFTLASDLAVMSSIEQQIEAVEEEIRSRFAGLDQLPSSGEAADVARISQYVAHLQTMPGLGRILAPTVAIEIGDIGRFSGPAKLAGYTGLCPRVYQSGPRDRRGKLTKHGPKYLRWALVEAAVHACRHPAYADRYQAMTKRMGKQRAGVARIDLSRRMAHHIYWMLTRNADFAPTGASRDLAA